MKTWFKNMCSDKDDGSYDRVAIADLLTDCRSEMKEMVHEVNKMSYGCKNHDFVIEQCAELTVQLMNIAQKVKEIKE